MISHTHRCIFIHIPRTGGSSIESVIWPGERTEADLWMGFTSQYHNKYQTGGLQHLLATQVRQEVGAQPFDAYFKFAFVRSPWDRAVSQYEYTRATRPDLREYLGMEETDSFRRYLELIRAREHVQWAPQHRFIYDENGKSLVDFVGRFECYASDAAAVLSRLGIESQIPHLNGSKRHPMAYYYDAQTAEMVADIYRRDVELFGYASQKV